MSKVGSRRFWWLTAGSFYAFFVFGFADNLKGPTLPALLQDMGFTYAQGGTILLGAYVGFLAATLCTGILSDMVGKKAVMYVAGVALVVGAAGYGALRSFWLLAGALGVLGFGLGSIELGGNAIIVDLHGERKGRYLNLLAVFHGLGSMVAPLFAGWLLAASFPWQRAYQFSVALFAILPLCFLCVAYPWTAPARRKGDDAKGLRHSAFTRRMGWFYLLIGAYVAAEIGIGAWIVEFLQKSKGQSVVQSSSYLSLFFGAIMAGRLLGSLIVERLGYLRIMLAAALASVVCLTVGTFGPPALAFFLPLSGLFFSVIFPTTTAAVSDLHQDRVGTILGLLFTFAGLGGMLGPWAIGLCSDALGIRLGFGVLIVFCLLMVVALLVLMGGLRSAADAQAGSMEELGRRPSCSVPGDA